jgi:hypothetical protein
MPSSAPQIFDGVVESNGWDQILSRENTDVKKPDSCLLLLLGHSMNENISSHILSGNVTLFPQLLSALAPQHTTPEYSVCL